MNMSKLYLLKRLCSSKKNILQILDYPFKRFNFFIIVFVILFIFFHSSIKLYYAQNFVIPYISKITTGYISWEYIAIILFLGILFFTRKVIRNYVYSGKIVTIYSIIIAIHMYYRLNGTWVYSKFTDNGVLSSVAYLDIIYFLTVPVVLSFYNRYIRKTTAKTNSVLIDDTPKECDSDILPDRRLIASKLINPIVNVNSDTSYAVGITSPWGNGKTTFLKYLMNKIADKDKDAILIQFSPWYCKSESDITSLFLDTIAGKLKRYHGSINTQINKYAKLILSLRRNEITRSLKEGLNMLSEKRDIKYLYDNINKTISELNRKVYISIDDIDRLHPEEILECFKIIRNTANFRNVIFIVAFDPEYVNKALAKCLKDNHKGYLDKIIQLQYNLPRISRESIIEYINKSLKDNNLINTDLNSLIEYSSNKSDSVDLSIYLNNIRECNRVLNTFYAHMSVLEGEIEIRDMFLVSILKVLYPTEALEIYVNINRYFRFDNGIELKIIPGTSEQAGINYEIDKLNSETRFKDLIHAIFFTGNSSIRSVASNYNYYIYYNGVLPNDFVSYSQFERAIISSVKMFRLIDRVQQIKVDNLLLKLLANKPTEMNDIKITLMGIMYCIKRYFAHKSDCKERCDIIDYLMSYEDRFIKIINSIVSDSNSDIILMQVAAIVNDIRHKYYKREFDHVPFPCNTNSEDGINSTILSITAELENSSVKILGKAVKNGHINSDLFRMYRYCFGYVNGNDTVMNNKANSYMLEIANASPSEFLKCMYKSESLQYAEDIFEDRDSFMEFVTNTINSNRSDSKLAAIYGKIYNNCVNILD